MRKLLLSLAAAGSVMTLASPAAAQWRGPGYGPGPQLQQEIQQLRIQRDNLARSGRLTGGEARDLDYDLQGLQRSFREARRNGISPRQANALQLRINHVRNELRRYSDNDGRRWRRRY